MILSRAVIFRWIIVAVVVVSAMVWGYHIIVEHQQKIALPVYGNKDENLVHHTIDRFAFTDQNSNLITEKTFENKIFVADFIFTTCPGICPAMSVQMSRIAEEFKNVSDVLLLSHTVKPEEDSVPVLKEYAQKYNADDSKWFFVTGKKSAIDRMARESYLVAGIDDDAEADFIHTQFLVLVDREMHIRGYYDGTDSSDVNKCIHDIKILLNNK